jgi:hypothetical protein
MTDEPNGRPNDRSIARQNRLRDALRENLKRRKSQSRGRIGQAAASQPNAASQPDAAGQPDVTGPDPAETNSVPAIDPMPDETT